MAHCILEGNADAVEFCPHEGYQHVLAASTYTLQEGDQPIRAGSISLFNVNAVSAENCNLELFHRVDTAGVFDIKWSPVGGIVGPLLAQADAAGYLRIYNLEGCSDEEKARGMIQVLFHFYVSFWSCCLSTKGIHNLLNSLLACLKILVVI